MPGPSWLAALSPLAAVLLALHLGILAMVAVSTLWMRRRRRARRPVGSLPRVSVLVPARNEEHTLPALLSSLLAQRYPDLQIVVVDDASEDGTADVLRAHADPRLHVVSGTGPPAGWIGKPHALYQAARRADSELYLFLDADARLADPDALTRLVSAFASCAPHESRLASSGVALTGLPRYRDPFPAVLLTSLVPFAVLAALPVPLVPRVRSAALSALNGQLWLIGAEDYRRLAPHEEVAAEILEDVMIGRYLKRKGVQLWFEDLSAEVEVRMYGTLGEAWRGFRKNAFLLAGGGRWVPFLLFFAAYALVWVVAPLLSLVTFVSAWLIKAAIDRAMRLPWPVSLFGPLPLWLGAVLQLDSARAHARGRVDWKGREVALKQGSGDAA